MGENVDFGLGWMQSRHEADVAQSQIIVSAPAVESVLAEHAAGIFKGDSYVNEVAAICLANETAESETMALRAREAKSSKVSGHGTLGNRPLPVMPVALDSEATERRPSLQPA